MVYLQDTSYISRIQDRSHYKSRIHADTRFKLDTNGQGWIERTSNHTPYTKDSEIHKTKYPSVIVIAGGGIYSKDEINMYKDSGADHFSLGTICFTPWKIPSILRGNN